MNLKEKIIQDTKAAMLARDSFLSDTLKGLKAAILYQEIATGKRESGLDNGEVETLLAKEVKKRLEAAELYEKGNNTEAAAKERRESDVIKSYLPEQLGGEAIQKLIEEAVQQTGATEQKDMGKVIGAVKAKAGSSVDGTTLAKLVKETLS